MLKTGTGRWSLVALAAVGVLAGAAFALESQTVSIPAGESFLVTAVLIPGSQGGTVYAGPGGRGSDFEMDEVDFNIGGEVVVNGRVLGVYDPQAQHTVTMRGFKVGNQWYCETTVIDDATQAVIAHDPANPMASQPAQATAQGQVVVSLTAQ